MKYTFGDILLFSFVHPGESAPRKRLAIVIGSHQITSKISSNDFYKLIVIAATSSRSHAELYRCKLGIYNWTRADFPNPSIGGPLFAVPIITTFSHTVDSTKIGSISKPDQKSLREFLERRVIGMS